MMTLNRIGLVSVTAFLLSGCGLFGGNETSALNNNYQSETATAEAIAEVQLEVGRENLGEGNLATATRYLQAARMHPSTRADATNALGVVYVRLGRLDVAQRYFSEALEVEPDNARFATNLARLEGDISFARESAKKYEVEPAADVAQSNVPVEAGIAQPAAQMPVERQRSQHVIHIQTADGPGQAPPQMEVYARRPVVQVAEREETQDEPAQVPERSASRAKVVDYPVRIEI